jgi:hypothetical protein
MNNAKAILQAVKGFNVVYTMYPVTTAAGGGAPIGAVVADAAAANTFTAADVVMVALNAITVEYWFCSAFIAAASGAENYVVAISNPIDVTVIYAFRASISAVTGNLGGYTPPIPVRCAPNSSTGARSASVSGTDSVTLSILVATGL